MKFLFWGRKEQQAAKPVAVVVHNMEQNTVVRWAQTWLIDFSDAILVRICQFCLMLGFIAGTIAVLSTKFDISAQPWFNITWAVVQAVAIDGLFFAVWSIWRASTGKGWLRTWYFFIGVLLGCVAALVNDIVSYSELSRISTISLAMQQLHIGESDFTLCRSVLVVLVSVLIVTLPRGLQVEQPVATPVEQPKNEALDTEKLLQTVAEMQAKAMQEALKQFSQVTVELVKETVERQIATFALPQIEAPADNPVEQGEASIQGDEPELTEQGQSSIQGLQSSGRYKSTYALQIEQLYQDNPDISVPEIIRVTGCSRPIATKWLNRVKPVVEA